MKIKDDSLLVKKQIYENQKFDKIFHEKDFNTDEDIIFKNCTFQNHVIFENINAREIFFYDCRFRQSFTFSNSKMLFLTISKCEIATKISFSENICGSHLQLKNIQGKEIEVNGEYQTFHINKVDCDSLTIKDINNNYSVKDSEIEFLNKSVIDKVFIKSNFCYSNIKIVDGKFNWVHFEGQFEKPINFDGEFEIDYLLFESSTFNNRVDLKKGRFNHIYFHRNNFLGLVNFNGYNILDKRKTGLTIKDLSLHSSTFEKNISLMLTNIESINISNCNFKQILHFNNHRDKFFDSEMVRISIKGSTQGSIIIENVFADIQLGDISFADIFFKDIEISFLIIDDFQNRGNLSFSNIISPKYLIIQNSITGKLNLLNENINKFKEIVISNSNIRGLAISIYPKKIRSYSSNPKFGYGIKYKKDDPTNLKNVYNQFKQIANRDSDIDAKNYFKSKEYNTLLKIKGFHYDSLLILLNWLSNEHGQNWFRGLLFTIVISIAFFYFYLQVIGFQANNFYQDYILFITSFPKLELKRFEECSKLWNVSLLIWGCRIAVGYGIYQTISAFRKFGKI